MTKRIEYTTTQAREKREHIRIHCLNEAIRSVGSLPLSGLDIPHRAAVLEAAKAFEVYITTGKLKTK